MYIKNWILIAVFRNWEQFQICSVFFIHPVCKIKIRFKYMIPNAIRIKIIFLNDSRRIAFVKQIQNM
jgi:hypothetical protein